MFTGTVIDIADLPPPVVGQNSGISAAGRRLAGPGSSLPRHLRVVRLNIAEVLSGVDPSQKEIEIVTGKGGGDCGFAFQPGLDYVVYAYKNAEGRLETGICSRTRALTDAAEDVAYLHAMANAPATGELRVRTSLGRNPGKPGIAIISERDGIRYRAFTNSAGDAVFGSLQPGDYTIHAEIDGDQPDDPNVQLHAKGCRDVTLFRILHITGHVSTKSGLPASRVEVQLRSTRDVPGETAITGPDGRYELRVVQPGEYYLGVNLNHGPTRDTPYPRWFHPGTDGPGLATKIEFLGRPESRSYDLTLPDTQPERVIEGVVLKTDGQPMPRAVVSVFDSSRNVTAQAIAGQDGQFVLYVFTATPYRLVAVWPGRTPADAASAIPMDIEAASGPLKLRLTLTEPGNSFFEEQRRGASGVR